MRTWPSEDDAMGVAERRGHGGQTRRREEEGCARALGATGRGGALAQLRVDVAHVDERERRHAPRVVLPRSLADVARSALGDERPHDHFADALSLRLGDAKLSELPGEEAPVAIRHLWWSIRYDLVISHSLVLIDNC